MKKILIVFLLTSASVVHGQRFTGGLLAGLNVSQIHGDTQGGYHKAGAAGGVFVKTDFRENWGGMLELRYNEKGSGLLMDDGTLILRLQYIEVPVMVTYDIFEKVQPQAGVSIGYLFRQVQREGGIVDPIDDFNPIEVAACLGAEYKISENLGVNIRYAISMIPIWQQFPGATSTRNLEAAYNDVISFAIYYRFGR
ncbi:MAG: PorT family protein [Bacteroidales bacterium]|nr:PorT family protein [Bacteroidales bacterium]